MVRTEIFISPTLPGTITVTAADSATSDIVGVNTFFTSSMVGKYITLRTSSHGDIKAIIANVFSPTSMRINTTIDFDESGIFYTITFVKLDLFEEISANFTYAISDIRDPDKRNTSFSKTVKIPGSKNNNQVFGHIFEVNINGTFNPHLKAQALVYIDTIQVFNGLLQLSKINILGEDKIEYECVILGKLANIFYNLGDNKLTDLDLSEFDHDWTHDNIVDSWATRIKKNGSNYDNFTGSVTTEFPNGQPSGEGYVYPMVYYGTTALNFWQTKDFYPAIYLKTYIDKIFAFAGFSYVSDFFNSQFFKKLIIPFNSETFRISDEDVLSRQFKATRTTDSQFALYRQNTIYFYAPISLIFQNDSTAGNSDISNVYDPTTGIWTVNKTGFYKIKAKIFIDIRIDVFGDGGTISGTERFNMDVNITSPGFGTTVLDSSEVVIDLNNSVSAGTNYSSTYTLEITTNEIQLNVGDQISLIIYNLAYATNLSGQTKYKVTTAGGDINNNLNIFLEAQIGSFFMNIAGASYVPGTAIEMSKAIPPVVQMRDLLMSVFRAFNLYVQPDPDLENTLLIEPRNDFYEDGVPVDWSDKLDISQNVELEPIGELNAKKYLYSYKPDSDYYNQYYQNKYGRTYGEQLIEITNDFIRNKKDTTLIFSATPSVGDSTNNRVIPRIIAIDQNGAVTPKISNIRLLYYSGLKTSDVKWKLNTIDQFTYPYCGHFDDPFNPTVDLNFGIPSEIFWTGIITYTNNNLFNKYHKRFIQEVSDKDSKIFTGWFYLTPKDIFDLDFRNQFFFQNSYWLLNKIYEFDFINNKVTKCEFIKLIQSVPFTAQTGVVTGGIGDLASDSMPSLYKPTPNRDNNYETAESVKVNGESNYVNNTAQYVIINGSNNVVQGNTRNIFITGDDNVVPAGRENVTIIDTNGVIVTESNVTYIGGIKINESGLSTRYDLIDGGEDTVRNPRHANDYPVLDGGQDEVRNVGAISKPQIINPGLNRV